MLYLTSFYCPVHSSAVHFFDEDKHKPCTGTCGHTICLECLQNQDTSSCPICQRKNAFDQANPNYTAIECINKCREDFWSTLKMWWSGENYGAGLCSKCVRTETLRICLTCHGNELCEFYGGKLRLRMRSEVDLVNLALHVICVDCLLDQHDRAHRSVKIDDIKYSKQDIKMTTAKIILKLFRDGMKKKQGLIDCKLRLERVENIGRSLFKLFSQLDYTDEDECGYLGELFKMELINKYIDNIDRKMDELFNRNHEENPICECTQVYGRIEQLWNEEGFSIYETMANGAIGRFTPGCPLYFESHLETRLKLYNIIEEKPSEKITPEPFNDRQCPTCVFIDSRKRNDRSDEIYRRNWTNIIETFWYNEMPQLKNYCVRCLEEFNHFGIGSSCKDFNEKRRIEKQGRTYFDHEDSRWFNQNDHWDENCEHIYCLMKDGSFWKYIIICHVDDDIRRMMDDGIRNIVWNCQLRKFRMELLTKNFINSIGDLNLRKHDPRTFNAEIAKVNALLENVKAQWNTFQNGVQDESLCKCTMIWEKKEKMLEKTSRENYDVRRKYYNLENKMVQMATHSLEESIGGCPMGFNHGIVLDASVLEELENIYSDDYTLTFQMMGISSGN